MQGSNSLNLPEKFTGTITGMFGEKGRQWLEELPEIIEKIAAEWSLQVGEAFPNLSYHYVASCVCADGMEAVLKLGFPGEDSEFFNEVKMLQFYGAQATVELLRVSDSHFAMLLEKLVPGETLGELCLRDDVRAAQIAVDILKKTVKKAPPDGGGFFWLENWIAGFERAKNTAFPQQSIKKAQDLFNKLAGDRAEKFLLHGDFHHENILSAEREPFLLIDPKGLVGSVGYDVAVFLNNHRNWLKRSPDLAAKLDHCTGKFAEAFQIEPQALREWAFVQMVLSAWWTCEEKGNWESELSKAEIWRV